MERFCDMMDNVWMDDGMRVMLCMRWGRDIEEVVCEELFYDVRGL